MVLSSSNLCYFYSSKNIIAKHGLQAFSIMGNEWLKVYACGNNASGTFDSLKMANLDQKNAIGQTFLVRCLRYIVDIRKVYPTCSIAKLVDE